MNKRRVFKLGAVVAIIVWLGILGLEQNQIELSSSIVKMPTMMALPSNLPDLAAVPVSTSSPIKTQISEVIDNDIPTLATRIPDKDISTNQIANSVISPIVQQSVLGNAIPLPSEALPIVNSDSIVIEVPEKIVPNQVVIHFESDTSQAERDAYISLMGGTVSQDIPALNTVVVSGVDTTQALPPSPILANTEPDYYVNALENPVNDPYYSEQWALPVIGADRAWLELPVDAPKIPVAVIDSGICANHEDLQGRILPGYDFIGNDSDPNDEFGHGCAVSGIIAANGNNGVGIAGVAPNAMIMPVRVLDSRGVGTYSDVATGIIWAVDHGARILNLSLGGPNPSSVLEDAVNYAVSHDVTIVAAAGNTGGNILYPAAYPSVISVGSVDQNLKRSNFSSYLPQLDILAPGRDILTTNLNNSYISMNGTSFATPYVSAIKVLNINLEQILKLNGGIVFFDNSHLISLPTIVKSPPVTPIITITPVPTENDNPVIDEIANFALTYKINENQITFYVVNQTNNTKIFGFSEDITHLNPNLIELSPDGRYIAYIVTKDISHPSDASLWLADIYTHTSVEILHADNQGWYTNPLWSPDGNKLAFVRFSKLSISDKPELWYFDINEKKSYSLLTSQVFGPIFFFGKTDSIDWSGNNSIQYYDERGSKNVYDIDLTTLKITKTSNLTTQILSVINMTVNATTNQEMNFPIAGLEAYNGSNNSTEPPLNNDSYTTAYLDDYIGGEFEGGGDHPGVDIPATCGVTEVHSVGSGTIRHISRSWGGLNPCGNNRGDSQPTGNYIVVEMPSIPFVWGYGGTVFAIYQHLYNVDANLSINNQNQLELGTLIGTVGSTGNSGGPHLHLQFDRATVSNHPYYTCNNDCSNTNQIDETIENTWNPMMFIQSHMMTSGVTVYDYPNYNANISAASEQFDVRDPYLKENPIGDNHISSARIPSGWVLTVCKDFNFKECKDFTENVPDFGAYGLDNAISSLKVSKLFCSSSVVNFQQCPPELTPNPTPSGNSDYVITNISYPNNISPGQKFQPEITVCLYNGARMGDGDMLRSLDTDEKRYGAYPFVAVVGTVNSGQCYTFKFYDNDPITAPTSDGTYTSQWKLWVNDHWVKGTEVVIQFTVKSGSVSSDGIAKLYDLANYSGNTVFSSGLGFSNAPSGISYSLELPSGWSAITWKGNDKNGEQRCWTSSVPNLQDHGWQNSIESLETFNYNACPPDDNVAIFYEDNNYRGDKRAYGKGWHNIGNGDFNDRASSFALPSGWSTRLYVNGAFADPTECFTNDTSELPATFNNSVSSLKVFNNPTCFDDAVPPSLDLCGGVIIHETGGGTRILKSSVADLGSNWSGDHIGFIEVLGNYQAIPHDTVNFQGRNHGVYESGTLSARDPAPNINRVHGTNVNSIEVIQTGPCDQPLPPNAPSECKVENPGVYLVHQNGQRLRLTTSVTNLNIYPMNTGGDWNDEPINIQVIGPYKATAYISEIASSFSHGPFYPGANEPAGSNVSSVRVEMYINCNNLPQPPMSPVNFNIVSAKDSIQLIWNDVANENGYKIFRWNGLQFNIIGTTPSDSTNFIDSNVTCDDTYIYKVLAFNGAGDSTDNWIQAKSQSCVDNDSPDTAVEIGNLPFTSTQLTTGAQASIAPVPSCGFNVGNLVWYEYTAPAGGIIRISTLGTDYDTVLAVFTGSSLSLTEIACNDDEGVDGLIAESIKAQTVDDFIGLTSQLDFLTVPNTTYYVLVGGYNGLSGNLVLTVTEVNDVPILPSIPSQANDEGNVVNLSVAVIEPYEPEVIYSASGLPSSLTIDALSGMISGSLTYSSAGTYHVVVNAVNSEPPYNNASIQFEWIVNDVLPPGAILLPAGIYQEDAPGLIYNGDWLSGSSDPTFRQFTNSTTMDFYFTGTGFGISHQVSDNRSTNIMEICIDELCQSVNNMSTLSGWYTVYFHDLQDSIHHVLVRPTVGKIRLDKLIIYDANSFPILSIGDYHDSDIRLKYSGDWGNKYNTQSIGQGYSYNHANGDKLSFAFTGTSFGMVYHPGKNSGNMRICIDNLPCQVIPDDKSIYWWKLFLSTPLQLGNHYVTIEALSDINTVMIDNLTIYGSPQDTILGPGVYEEDNPALIYINKVGKGWIIFERKNVENPYFRYTFNNYNAVTFTFNGTGFGLRRIVMPASSAWRSEVCVDSVCQIVNHVGPQWSLKAVYFKGYSPGIHYVLIRPVVGLLSLDEIAIVDESNLTQALSLDDFELVESLADGDLLPLMVNGDTLIPAAPTEVQLAKATPTIPPSSTIEIVDGQTPLIPTDLPVSPAPETIEVISTEVATLIPTETATIALTPTNIPEATEAATPTEESIPTVVPTLIPVATDEAPPIDSDLAITAESTEDS